MIPSQEPKKESPARVLIVDDHPNTASMLARALEKGDLETPLHVLTARDSAEALKHFDSEIDILITDFMMPDMSGLGLIETLQESGKKPGYTILMTAYDSPGMDAVAKRLNVDRYLVKPVRPEMIQSIVRQQLDGYIQPVYRAEEPVRERFSILVLDNLGRNFRSLVRTTAKDGVNFLRAGNFEEANRILSDEKPDLFILDSGVLNSSNFERYEEMQRDPQLSEIPIFILSNSELSPTGFTDDPVLGGPELISEPYDWNDISVRIMARLKLKRLEDDLRQRNRELSLLPEIGQDLSARLDLAELAEILLERLVVKLGADGGQLIIFQKDGKVFHESFGKWGFSDADKGKAIAQMLSEGAEARIIADRQGGIIQDTTRSPNWLQTLNYPTRSALIVPLLGREDVLGVITLVHESRRYFKPSHLYIVEAIASQAAIAIENAHLSEAINQERRRLSAVLNNVADAILMTDQRGALQIVNPAGNRLFTDINTQIGTPLQAGKGYDPLIDFLETAQHPSSQAEQEISWPDGRTFSARASGLEEGGQVTVLHDVSHFKELGRLKDEYIAAASHDLKNPITLVLWFADLVRQLGPLNEAQSEHLTHIEQSAVQMNELVLNLLELARLDTGEMRPNQSFNLASLLDEVAGEFPSRAQKTDQIVVFEPGVLATDLVADRMLISQAVRNLVGNAIKYTPEGGHITVGIRENADEFIIFVKDTGLGIPAKDLPHIFEKFYRVTTVDRREIEGNGLGLAIVKAVADKHGGKVEVESELGIGSCFSLYIPKTGQNVLSVTP